MQRWSEKEIRSLKYYVNTYGYTVGLKKAALNLDRSIGSVTNKYQKLTNTGEKRPYRRLSYKKEEIAKYLECCIKENPRNLSAAFRKTAQKYDIGISALQNQYHGCGYYRKSRESNPIYKGNLNCFYIVGGSKTIKNSKSPQPTNANNIEVPRQERKTGFIFNLLTRLFNLNK